MTATFVRFLAFSFSRPLAGTISPESPIPTVVIGEAQEPERIIEALERGARRYIPTSLSLADAVQVLRLIGEGSTAPAQGAPAGDR